MGAYMDVITGLYDPAQIDQGVDYFPKTEPTPVKAIGDCVITRSDPNSGWPGGAIVVYQLTADGEAKGQYIYVAEHLSNLPQVGHHYNAGDVICQSHMGWPWTEWGWATASGQAWDSHVTVNTAGGIMFARWLRSIGSPTIAIPGGDQGQHVPGGPANPITSATGDQGGAGQGAGGASSDLSGAIQYADQTASGQHQQFGDDPSDPRDNLPFSAQFMSWGYGYTGNPGTAGITVVSPTYAPGDPAAIGAAFQEAQSSGAAGPQMNQSALIRGGISELYVIPGTGAGNGGPAQTFRPRGNFKCYFMMNPESISVSTNIETGAGAPTPPQLNSPQNDASMYLMDTQTVTWTLVFNRMYEVWKGPGQGFDWTVNRWGHPMPGPAELGCRWDIRALERLTGLLDASNYVPTGTTGQGTSGSGPGAPASMPVQVVFGGVNSYRFTGRISALDYSYDIFSKDMIPLQATVQISVTRVWNAIDTSQDLINSLVQQVTAGGTPVVPNQTGGFNSYLGRANLSDQNPDYLSLMAGVQTWNPAFVANPNLANQMDKTNGQVGPGPYFSTTNPPLVIPPTRGAPS